MSEATLIFQNMRGGCATVGKTVHTLFRVNGRRPGLKQLANDATAITDQHLAREAEITREPLRHLAALIKVSNGGDHASSTEPRPDS